MKFRFLGHAGFEFSTKGKKIVIDPFISGNPLANHIRPEDVQADYILLTHAHGDHTADAEGIAKRCGSVIISNYEIVSYYENKGIKGHPMNHGGKFVFEFGTVKYIKADHSSVFPDGTYGGQPGGFVIWNDEISLYFSGDTALTTDMKLIPMTCPTIQCAILPIGDNFTMGADDAVLAAQFVECKKVIGCHFDTFGYIVINHEEAKKKFANQGIQLILPSVGEEFEI